MASPKLEDREKKINEIRRLNGFSNIKAEDFKQMSYRNEINFKIKHKFGFEYYNDALLLPDGQTTHDIYQIEKRYEATESFFGISFDENKQFLRELSCIDYEIGKTIYDYEIRSEKKNLEEFENDVMDQLEEVEKIPYIKNVYVVDDNLLNSDPFFYEGCYIDIRQKYQEWEEYCLFVDSVKDCIHIFIPNFNKLSGDKKFELIEKLSENYITADIAEYVQDYHLNEHSKAKIDKLTYLQLPNLTEPKIIEKFVRFYIKQKSLK